MADKTWNSADGVYTTGFGGAALASSDRGIFPANNEQAVTSGHTAQNAVDAALIWVQEGYDEDIGSSGSELYTSTGELRFEGGGKLWFKAGDNAVDKTIIRARPATAAITSATLNGTGTTDYTDIRIQQGTVALGGNMSTIASLAIMGQSVVTLAAGTGVTLLHMAGGTFTSDGSIVTAEVIGGVVNINTAVVSTELRVFGGTVNLLFGGTYPLINQYGGFIDMTRSGQVKVVTEWNQYGGTHKTNALTTITTLNQY